MNEKKFDKSKLLTTVVTVVLIFFFVGGFMIGLDRVQSMEGTFPPNELKESLTNAPENTQQALDYLVNVLNKARSSDSKINFDDSFSIDSDSIKTNGSDAIKQSMLLAIDGFESHISSVEESEDIKTSTNFGENMDTVLRLPDILPEDIKEFNCSYIYYACPSCGESADEQYPKCDLCGSAREYFIKYRNEYEIELVLDTENIFADGSVLYRNFTPRTDSEIAALTSSVLENSADVKNTQVSYKSLKIVFTVNRLTDEIKSLRFIKDMSVATDVTFLGEYEKLGSINLSFDVTENSSYGFSWPKLSLSAEKIVIEPGKTDNLLAALTCENPLDMVVTWVSSNPEIATVDEEGYIDASKNAGEAVITASFEYLGKTYSDECLVVVRVPVESMKMVDNSVSLSVGSTQTLETKVSPSDATVKTVTWYSEDEKIATVDENGVVTGVSAGEVIVYALSDDGYYKSTCEVSVE